MKLENCLNVIIHALTSKLSRVAMRVWVVKEYRGSRRETLVQTAYPVRNDESKGMHRKKINTHDTAPFQAQIFFEDTML